MTQPKKKDEPPKMEPPKAPTFKECVINAARILHYAEMETDIAKMSMFDTLATSWGAIGSLIHQREVDNGNKSDDDS